MKTETKKTHRRVPERIVMAHFNDKLAAYVNTGIASCSGSNFENQHQNARGPHAPHERKAAMNFSSSNGFMKNATGPIAMAVARAARSSRAVMTITFVRGEIAQRRARSSKPVTSSIQMSVTTIGT